MSDLLRELVEEKQAEDDLQDLQPGDDSTELATGFLQITSNDGEGLYKGTEVIWDSQTSEHVPIEGGFEEEVCRAFAGCVGGQVGLVVPYMEVFNKQGEIELIIDTGGGNSFPARIYWETNGVYTWDEYSMSTTGEFSYKPNGRTGANAKEFNGTVGLYEDSCPFFVLMYEFVDENGDKYYRFAQSVPPFATAHKVLTYDDNKKLVAGWVKAH